ncbi:MAG: GNAT family N-acetyltransferase [Bacteroidota bacterium]
MSESSKQLLHFTVAKKDADLQQILSLQQQNLTRNIDSATAKAQGFVTVEHDLKSLKIMNDRHPHVIAKGDETVVGYALCMSPYFAKDIPILVPMFERIHQLNWNEQLISASDYIIMGQVCVAKAWRGKGVFKRLYAQMQQTQSANYPLVITEIASRNTRSLRAHEKVGFETLEVYESGGEEWQIVVWDWREK